MHTDSSPDAESELTHSHHDDVTTYCIFSAFHDGSDQSAETHLSSLNEFLERADSMLDSEGGDPGDTIDASDLSLATNFDLNPLMDAEEGLCHRSWARRHARPR